MKPEDLHGLVCRWLERANGADHEAARKPFAISPLFDTADGRQAFEIGLLNDDLEALIVSGARQLQRGQRMAGAQCSSSPDGLHLDRRATWEELLGQARPRRLLRVRFETPTFFRRGRIAHPLPVAASVFGHWRSRWRAFAPADLAAQVEVDLADPPLSVAELDGATTPVLSRGSSLVGFVGTVGYRRHGNDDAAADFGRRVDGLASIAPFAGTGSLTTLGFGVTGYLP